MMLVLETSNPSAGERASWVAIGSSGGTLIETEYLGSSARSDGLMAAVAAVAARASIEPNAITRIGVSVGPGGYTALRSAVAAAQSLSLATGAELVSIETAQLVYESTVQGKQSHSGAKSNGPVGVALASKGTLAHLTLMRPDQDVGLQTTESIGVVGSDALGEHQIATLLADHHLPPAWREAAATHSIDVLASKFDPQVGVRLTASGSPIPPSEFGVRYSREPDAVTQWRARHPQS